MSSGIVLSPNRGVTKTRNAILRMKKCSPELRTILRQRCQERILNDRLKILNTFRKVKIQDSFQVALGNILKEEWENIENDKSNKNLTEFHSGFSPPEDFNLDNELLLEEVLEKELLLEHEGWLLQLYEELTNEDFEESKEVVCPLCCTGYLQQVEHHNLKRTFCTKCAADFVVEKSLPDLQAAIFKFLSLHDKQCNYNSSFANVPKNENENNLCIICHHCSHLNVIEIEGLLRRGSVLEQKPLWFDVYKAFPPKYDPTFSRLEPDTPVKKIFYKEDILRARIHKEFRGRLGAVNLEDHSKSTSQNLLETCQKYISEGMTEDDAIKKLISLNEQETPMNTTLKTQSQAKPHVLDQNV